MDQPLEELVGETLRRRNLRLAVAESCTGGLVGHRITNIPGSSDYYLGSVTAYAYGAKVQLLGVAWETLNSFGAVSRETVLEMARGVRRVLGAEVGLSVSGIAGPGGATPDKPVGTVWIGLSAPGVEDAWHYRFEGDRLQVKEQSAEQALGRLLAYLQGGTGAKQQNMELINVTVRFNSNGRIAPVDFTWGDVTYPVESTGRRWEDEQGQHILVMVPGDRVFDLVYQPSERLWYLRQIGPGRSAA